MRSDIVQILELELWSHPGMFRCFTKSHDLAAECVHDLGLAKEVVLGLSNIPNAIDSRNLALAISENELKLEAFVEFCTLNAIQPDSDNNYAASSFLNNEYGFPIAWLHIPESNETEKIVARIANWSTARKMCVVEPSELYCLTFPDLNAPEITNA